MRGGGGEGVRGGEGVTLARARASQEKQNGANFSFIAPSSEE